MPFNGQGKPIICYNGEVLVFQLSDKDCAGVKKPTNETILDVKRMVFNRGTETFILKSTGVFRFKENKSHLKILCCNCVSDFRTRINLPCILIQCKNYAEVFTYYILFLHSTNKFEKRLSFELGHELNESLKVFDGPLIFWQHLNTVFYISCQTGKVTNLSVKLSSIQWIGEIENLGIILVGPTEPFETECTPQLSESDYEFSNSKYCAYALESQEILSHNYIIPLAYSSVVTHMHVCAAEFVDSQLRLSLLALTQRNQLILFQNGIPQRVCHLPFIGPSAVQILDSGRGNLFFIVSFQNSGACAVSANKFKVIAKWDKVHLGLVDDFIGVGTEQVLLLFADSLNSFWLTPFKIIDLVRIKYSSDPLDRNEDTLQEREHENYYLVLPALEAQLKAELTFLQRIKQHISLKDEIITKSWAILRNSIQGTDDSSVSSQVSYFNTFFFKECLVLFCGEEENSVHTSNENLSDTFQEPEHVIEQTWCRVLDDNLVVGVKVTFLKPFPNDMTLSLMMDQSSSSSFQLIKYQNQTVSLSIDSSSEAYLMPSERGPQIKKIKLTSDSKEEESCFCGQASERESTHIITAVTSLSPFLALNKLCCTLVLHSSDRDNDKYDCISCGRLVYTVEHLFSKSSLRTFLKKKSTDLLSLLAILHKSCFHIMSPPQTPNLMKMWLLKYMDCEIMKEFPEIHFYQKPRNCGTLKSLFYWEQRTVFEGILTVYCRNQSILFECLQHLITHLPTNCFFKYLKFGSKDFLIDHLAFVLEKELVTFGSVSTSALHNVGSRFVHECKTNEEKESARTDSSNRSNKIHLHKRQVERERIMMDMNLRLSTNVYTEMNLALAEIQLKSDLIAMSLAYL
uniref:Fanconi anemia, complementation group B n=1 Tax=Nannospalax galili TaxID=1026970 RepID=A0A8C6RAQ9_NANGA